VSERPSGRPSQPLRQPTTAKWFAVVFGSSLVSDLSSGLRAVIDSSSLARLAWRSPEEKELAILNQGAILVQLVP